MRGFDEEVRTETQTVGGGGKGGGGGGGVSQTTTTVSYHYFIDLAVGLCAGPIAAVRRAFADGNVWKAIRSARCGFIGATSVSRRRSLHAVAFSSRLPAYRQARAN